MIDEDEAYGLRCDIGRLEQENATLRQQLEDVTVSMGRLEERHAKTFEIGKRWMAKAARFESENTKLRELIYERAHEHAIQHMTEDELRITTANALDENRKLRELATYALRHIIEVWCDDENNSLFRGKPCEDCADSGSSDCPKCMPRMFDVSGIEVDG